MRLTPPQPIWRKRRVSNSATLAFIGGSEHSSDGPQMRGASIADWSEVPNLALFQFGTQRRPRKHFEFASV
jgi:hypothetical protein